MSRSTLRKVHSPHCVLAARLGLLGFAGGLGACGGSGPHPVAAAPVVVPGRPAASEADIRFMQDMIRHHGQALVMAGLVPDRTRRQDLRLLAERIDVSQRDEIRMMSRWLHARGATAPDPLGEHVHGDPMPGMLSPEDLGRLRTSRAAEFDRLFLAFMIRHHEGALVMVAELFRRSGTAQDPELFGFASDVDADQRAEIRRMRALLARLGPASTP